MKENQKKFSSPFLTETPTSDTTNRGNIDQSQSISPDETVQSRPKSKKKNLSLGDIPVAIQELCLNPHQKSVGHDY